MQPLHESAERKVADQASDDVVLALARAYTLSEIFPIHHPTVQDAMREVASRARGTTDFEVTAAGIRCEGRAIVDRHGYLRELTRDLRSVGVTALRLLPELGIEGTGAFLDALRESRNAPHLSFEARWEREAAEGIVAAFAGDRLPEPTAVPVLEDLPAELERSMMEMDALEADALEPDAFESNAFEAGALEAPESEPVDGAIEPEPWGLPHEPPPLDPVDARLDDEIGAQETQEEWASTWDTGHPAPELQAPDEAEWRHAVASAEAEGEEHDRSEETFAELTTLPAGWNDDEAADDTESDPDSIPAEGEDTFAEPVMGLASLMSGSVPGEEDASELDVSTTFANPTDLADATDFGDASDFGDPSDFADASDFGIEGGADIGSAEGPLDALDTTDPFEEQSTDFDIEAASGDLTGLGAEASGAENEGPPASPTDRSGVADPWDESDTPMPWEDVGGFWNGEAEWSGPSEDAFWTPPEDRIDETLDAGDDDPSEVASAEESTEGVSEGVALQQEVWSLEEVESETLGAEGPEVPPVVDSPGPGQSAPVEGSGSPSPMEAQRPDASTSSEEERPDAVPAHSEPERAPEVEELIRSERDLQQVHAFRQALGDLSGVSHVPEAEAEEVTDLVGEDQFHEPEAVAELTEAEPTRAAPEHPSIEALEETGTVEVVPVATLAPEATDAHALGDRLSESGFPLEAAEAFSFSGAPAAVATEPEPFDEAAYTTLTELALACLRSPAARQPAARAAVLDRGRKLLAAEEFAGVADAVEAVLLDDGVDSADAGDLARRLMEPGVSSILMERLGEAKLAEERERALRVATGVAEHLAPELSRALSQVPPRAARRNYLDAMFGMGEAAFRESLPMLEDSRWFIVRNGVDIIGEVDGPQAIERLAGPLAHPDSRVRRATVMAMAKLGGDEAGLRLLKALDDPEADVREAAAMALGHLRVQRALRPLLHMLEAEKGDDMQMILLRSLGQIADAEAVPAIEKRALGSFFSKPSTAVRIAAYRALSGMGTPHASALIRQAVDDKNPEVAAAARALAARL